MANALTATVTACAVSASVRIRRMSGSLAPRKEAGASAGSASVRIWRGLYGHWLALGEEVRSEDHRRVFAE